MNKKQFSSVEKFINEILNRANLSFVEVSNSLLHIHRYQNDYLERYMGSFVENNTLIKKARKSRFRIPFPSFIKLHFNSKEISIVSDFDVVIISHFVSKPNKEPYSDFYFSQIIDSLLKLGYRVKVVYINEVEDSTLQACNQLNDKLFYTSFEKNISAHIALYFLGAIFLQSLIYSFQSFFNRIPEKKRLYRIISGMESSWSNLCISYNVGRLVKKDKPKFLFTTFEGQAYERLIYYFCKRFDKDVIRIGYLHAAIFEYQFSVKRSLGSSYDPDLILTQGDFAARVLSHSYNSKQKIIKTVGSPRLISYNYISDKEKAILFLPSGIFTEVIFFLDFSKKLCELLPTYKIYFRFHPSFDIRLLGMDFSIEKLPFNFFISNSSLEADSNRCKFTLFRDSTAILNAVAQGSLPVHVRMEEEELFVNPIYGINDILPNITSPCEFKDKLDSLNSMDACMFQNGIRDIVSEYNEKNLIEAINSLNL
uniref:hypothetical protein n=1 Tax=Flavobacterium sp. TaxID=239 RepID=UPI00404B662B